MTTPTNKDTYWIVRALASDLAPKLSKLRCRVAYNECNLALDGMPTITILPYGKRKPPYIPIAHILAHSDSIRVLSEPLCSGLGLDGHPMWVGGWQTERHFEYANPELETDLLDHIDKIIKHGTSH